MSGEERQLAALLADIAATGEIPVIGHDSKAWDNHPMMTLARQLFVTGFDLGPLLTLGVGISGRNLETFKDLTVEHDVIGGQGRSGGTDQTPPRSCTHVRDDALGDRALPASSYAAPVATTCCWSR